MTRWTDGGTLRNHQYRDADQLNARVRLHRRFSTNPYPWHRWVFDHLDLPHSTRILDLGSGPGDLWVENLERIPNSWRITLNDLSIGMTAEARQRLTLGPALFAYCTADAEALPFAPDSFDGVIANHMLYHVCDLGAALHEISRVLTPGGRILAATNGIHHMRELRELASQFIPRSDPENVAARFSLENGERWLSSVFEKVRLFRQENNLVVTEAEPLLAYVRSMHDDRMVQAGMEGLRQCIQRRIAVEGAIHVRKDAGIFVAVRSGGWSK